MFTCNMMRFLSLLLLGLSPCVVSVVMWSSLVCLWGCCGTLCGWGGCCDCDACTRVCAAWVSAVIVWWCEVDDNDGVGEGWGVMSAGHVSGTRGLGIVSSAVNVLWMSMVRGMWGVGVVCEVCMCLARGGVGGEGGEWMRGLGLGFTNPVGTGGVLDVCLCLVGCRGVGWCRWGWLGSLNQALEEWGSFMSMWGVSLDYLCRLSVGCEELV